MRDYKDLIKKSILYKYRDGSLKDFLEEVFIMDVSPSGKYIKFVVDNSDGHKSWESIEDFVKEYEYVETLK